MPQSITSDADLPRLYVQVLSLFGIRDRLAIAEMVELAGGIQHTLKVRLREWKLGGFSGLGRAGLLGVVFE